MIWIGGQLGPSQGGFERTVGESQVMQVVTMWRLNINKVPVILASVASLVLFIMVIWLTEVPSRIPHPSASITGISVLEILWVVSHSQTLHEHMIEIEDPSLDNLRQAGMFQISLGEIHGPQAIVSESVEGLLE
ncbi:hypothetical protein EV363DRAFT_1224592 [Boletus edulis]|nr:hypothetical protein EV363DRAFT_1224592 [Boletus edulis]